MLTALLYRYTAKHLDKQDASLLEAETASFYERAKVLEGLVYCDGATDKQRLRVHNVVQDQRRMVQQMTKVMHLHRGSSLTFVEVQKLVDDLVRQRLLPIPIQTAFYVFPHDSKNRHRGLLEWMAYVHRDRWIANFIHQEVQYRQKFLDELYEEILASIRKRRKSMPEYN